MRQRLTRTLLASFLFLFSVLPPGFSAELPEIQLTTPAFKQGEMIPKKHTCEGKDQSPAFRWTQGPKGTQSYAILTEDPDAPNGMWTHWILYDLPPTIDNLPSGVPPILKLANAEKHGTNDFGKLGYGGPCPPSGTHRYFFKIYALDTMLNFKTPPKRQEFLDAIEGHILAEGMLMGRYAKKKQS